MVVKYFFLIFVGVFLIIGCTKDSFFWDLPMNNIYHGKIADTSGFQVQNKFSPIIHTGSVSEITESTSIISAEIESLGSSEITSYGHCWSTQPSPTISNFNTNLGKVNSVGIFKSNLSELSPNTQYFVRAYAINSNGISYGEEINFTTKATLAKYFNCETLEGFNLFVDKLSSSRDEKWVIGNGFKGKGLVLSGPNYGGYIEFSINLSKTSYMTFWTRSVDPGYPNRDPEVYIDGINLNFEIIENEGWMKIKTKNIFSGNHLIKINYPHISRYYDYYIDEIEFFYQ